MPISKTLQLALANARAAPAMHDPRVAFVKMMKDEPSQITPPPVTPPTAVNDDDYSAWAAAA
jgi:hypothetical protein